MAIIEVKGGNRLEGIQELLRSMLSKGVVSAVLVPREIASKKTVVQTLVRDPAKLDNVNPLAPVLGINSARIIARMCSAFVADEPASGEEAERPSDSASHEEATADDSEQKKEETPEDAPQTTDTDLSAEASAKAEALAKAEPKTPNTKHPTAPPIAVVLRSCEIRALVELVKLQQADMERFLVVGVDCFGTYSVKDYEAIMNQASQDASVTEDFLKEAAAGNFPEDLRGACRICQYPEPTYADMTIQFIGEDINRQMSVHANTEKGKAVFKALGLEESPESNEREAAISKLKEARKQLAEQDKIDFLEVISSLCINCHNCRAVCPICYCKQCLFDGKVFEYPFEKYLNWSGKKGSLNMPPDKLLFHLTRMSHVGSSCVACGQCEAACPNSIPLGRIYQKISAAAQAALGYEAGRSLDDELPLATFREDELSVVEN